MGLDLKWLTLEFSSPTLPTLAPPKEQVTWLLIQAKMDSNRHLSVFDGFLFAQNVAIGLSSMVDFPHFLCHSFCATVSSLQPLGGGDSQKTMCLTKAWLLEVLETCTAVWSLSRNNFGAWPCGPVALKEKTSKLIFCSDSNFSKPTCQTSVRV